MLTKEVKDPSSVCTSGQLLWEQLTVGHKFPRRGAHCELGTAIPHAAHNTPPPLSLILRQLFRSVEELIKRSRTAQVILPVN
jgi:hypothetical protein